MHLEETDKVLRIFKPQPLAYLGDGQRVVIQQLLGMGKEAVGNDVLGGTPRFCFYQCTELACGKATLIGKPSHGRKAFPLGFGYDIVVEHGDKPLYHSVVYLFAGDELAVVEA